MNNDMFLQDQNDQQNLIEEVTDEALEATGDDSQATCYTLGGCTGLSSCPA